MNIKYIIWSICIITALLSPVPASAAESGTLENEYLKLTFGTLKGLKLVSLYSKRQDRELLNREGNIPLYQVELYRNAQSIVVGALQADQINISYPVPSELRIAAMHLKYNLEVICNIQLPPKSEKAVFFIEVARQNRDYRIGIIRYPGYAIRLEESQKNPMAMLPVADGQLVADPLANMGDGEIRQYEYPGVASAQVMAMVDSQGGIVTYAADGDGIYKVLSIRRYGKGLLLLYEHITYQGDDLLVRVPYAVELGTFEGGWERAADVYKNWAVKQKWCRTRLQDRDLPAYLKNPSFFLGLNVREMAGESKSIDRSLEIPELVKGWKEGLGIPVSTILLSWEKHGPWVTPDYFPPYGGEAQFTALVRNIHQQGNYSMLYLSGLNYTIEKTPRHGAPYYKAKSLEVKSAEGSAIVGLNGSIKITGSGREGIGKYYTLCPSTPMARQTLINAVNKVADLGIDIVQVDQIVGGGTPPCFSTRHDHAPGGGSGIYRSMSALLEEVSVAAKKKNPLATISLEEPSELFIPYVDIFHTREYMQGFWPRDRKGSVGIPLFSYLYHEYALGYGGDSAPLAMGKDDPEVAIYAQAMNLISGRMPAGAVWMKMVPFETLHAALKRFMQDTASLLSSPAGRYILYGKMVDGENQSSSSRQVFFTKSGKSFSFPVKNVMTRGFQLKDGSVGFLFINTTDSAQDVGLNFMLDNMPGKGIIKWPASEKPVKSGDHYKFPPYGMMFLILK